MKQIQDTLFELQDTVYQAFQRRLVPTLTPEKIIGVRMPAVRAYAKRLKKETPELAAAYIQELPHFYMEEYLLHGALVSMEKDYETALVQTKRLLPFIDNWMTCDLLSPKVFAKHRPKLLGEIDGWLASDAEYTVRFGMKMLMSFYLDDAFTEDLPEKVAAANTDAFYVKMMTAWYFATALAKQYEAAVPYLEEKRLDKWTHNKTIQKAVESYRVTDAHKKYLRTLRIH